ncbi:Pumilio domain-containing protein -like protein [Trichinella pseudospiralis]|uniref:Pumilio domain-containing protein-like protein n=1 Tax=Trichinella pseudospiralis TaxID=6337 RepID=A0A0V1JX30_TRIPS|nr:Pumilio domain-containing protein -like protein [Trichinella pseudospiralis]KRZ39501.1 Pumilio domain-containing protein -like protein [Trichinella pseudospiralis]
MSEDSGNDEMLDLKKNPTEETETVQLTRHQKGAKIQALKMNRSERRKQLRQKKLLQKPYHEIIIKAKPIWEKLRRHDTPTEEKKKLAVDLNCLLRGSVKSLAYAHDTVRIIQGLFSMKMKDISASLFDQLKDDVVAMAKSKYARHIVMKMLKYGNTSQRKHIISSFYGHIPELACHTYAADVLQELYITYAKNETRKEMISEFYLSKYKLIKENVPSDLSKVIEENPSAKEVILKNIREYLLSIADKPVLQNPMLHRLLHMYLQNCTDNEKTEMVDGFIDRAIELVHTNDGCNAALDLLWVSTVKDRRKLLKSMRMHVTKMCLQAYSYIFVLAILECVDDRVALEKIVLREIFSNLESISKSKTGIKVLLYLMMSRDRRYIPKGVIDILEKGDNKQHRKKSLSVKVEEIVNLSSKPLLNFVTEHLQELLSSGSTTLLIPAVLEKAVGNKRPAYESICSLLNQSCNDQQAILQNLHLQFLLNKLLINDRRLLSEGKSKSIPFAQVFIERLTVDHLRQYCNEKNTAFVILHLYETGLPAAKTIVKALLKNSTSKNDAMEILQRKIHTD